MNIENLRDHKFIVIGEEHYTPLGAIRSLGENGIYPIAIVLKSNEPLTSLSRYIRTLYCVDSYEEAFEILINQYGNETPKPFVIPCDDRIVELLDKRYNKLQDKFYVSNAMEAGRITHFMNKYTLCELAQRHGINVAKSWVVKRGDIPKGLTYPIITKPLTSYAGWKQDYRVCNNEAELRQAYQEVKGTDFMLQQYIKKVNELCLDGVVVNHGRQVFTAIASTYTYILPDYYSMEMVVKNFDDNVLQDALNAMFAEIGYEGIFSVEFLLDSQECPWFLEINFRNSTWSYASTKLGMNLPLLWAQGCLTGSVPKEARQQIPEHYVALAEITDFYHRVFRLKLISVWQWAKGISKANCLFFWNKEDKKPTIVYWLKHGVKFLKIKLHIGEKQP